MDKKSFILYLDRKKEIDLLSDAQCGVLFKAIFEYADTGKAPEISDLAVSVLLSFLITQIDANAKKWEETKKKRSEAGKLGGRPKKQIKANESNEKQTKAKKAVTVTDTVTDTVTVTGTVTVTDNIKAQDCTIPDGTAQPASAEEDVIPWDEIDFELV